MNDIPWYAGFKGTALDPEYLIYAGVIILILWLLTRKK